MPMLTTTASSTSVTVPTRSPEGDRSGGPGVLRQLASLGDPVFVYGCNTRSHQGAPNRSADGLHMRCSLLLAALALLAVMLAVLLHIFHGREADGASSPRSVWLKLHPPQQTHHDAELLRRRMLATIETLNTTELVDHVPQLVACLGHHDLHVRELALRLLRRLQPTALVDHAETLVTVTLTLINHDDAATLWVLQTLLAVADMPTIASGRTAIFQCLLAPSSSAEVHQTAANLLALLEPEDLASYAEDAVEAVMQRKDVPLARAIVSSWAIKLETEACRARAGESACQGALRTLRKLTGTASEGGE